MYYRDKIEIRNIDVIVNHSNGRVVYSNGSGSGEYQYYLKDHLGNRPYVGNNPINFIDVAGGFKLRNAGDYPLFNEYLNKNLSEILHSPAIMNALLKFSNGGLDYEKIKKDIMPGYGPTIVIEDIDEPGLIADGKYRVENGEHRLYINKKIVDAFERVGKKSHLSYEIRQAYLLGVVSTLLHEYVHYGERNNEYCYDMPQCEAGHLFEKAVYSTGLSLRPGYYDVTDPSQILPIINLKKYGKYNIKDRSEELQPELIDRSVLPTVPVIK